MPLSRLSCRRAIQATGSLGCRSLQVDFEGHWTVQAYLRVVMQRSKDQEVYVDPDGAPPIRRIVLGVLFGVQAARATQRLEPVPSQHVAGLQLLQLSGKLSAVGRQKSHQQREQTHVSAMIIGLNIEH